MLASSEPHGPGRIMTLWVGRRRGIQCNVERILQTEIQSRFRIHPNLFTFTNCFNSGAGTRSGGTPDNCAFSPAGNRADCRTDRRADAR